MFYYFAFAEMQQGEQTSQLKMSKMNFAFQAFFCHLSAAS